MKNVEDNMGVITKYLKQTEDNALVFIIGETGSGKILFG
jgi:transcriptional regulator with PAS, ATPase and Fis domain